MDAPCLTNRLCLTSAELLEAFRLRYASYGEKGFIAPNEEGLFYDRYDALPNCLTFAVYNREEMVGSIRACTYSSEHGWFDIPAKYGYPSAFATWMRERNIVIEWNRFVIHPRCSDLAATIEFALLGAVPFFASYFDSPSFMAGVRENHVKFYQRFGYERISGLERYPNTNFKATLMAMDWANHAKRIREHRAFSRCFEFQPSVTNIDTGSRRLFDARFREPCPA